MTDDEILAAFSERRTIYDTYLQANGIELCTCPGCGFPSLTDRGEFEICIICFWEDDGQDDNEGSILSGLFEELQLSGPNDKLSLRENRINIGRILESSAEMIDGEIDLNTARVLETIAFYQLRRMDIEGRMTGEESAQDHIWLEWQEVRKDLQTALVVPKTHE
ncbi:CPCC family cysteine-rich protein [Chitinophaga pinensis]|nr:CPCC family cysteine-rich protein [Chitinophaga pinensis]